MPLIVIAGYPTSGKTERAYQLKEFFEAKSNTPVIIVSEESLLANRETTYKSPTEEKKFRAAILSSIERHLSKDTLVICDSLNYIKGFRYQLYCIARSLNTPHSVVYCGVSIEQARSFHLLKQSDNYTPTQFEELIQRFEEPDDKNRWDAPLFTILKGDPIQLFSEKINDALFKTHGAKPRMSTVVKPLTETNYVHEAEKTVSEIIDSVLKAQRDGFPGGKLVIKGCSVSLLIPSRNISISELRQLKRQFMLLNTMRTQIDLTRLAESFVNYMNIHFSS